MTFYMPTRVYEEPDCVAAHAAELASSKAAAHAAELELSHGEDGGHRGERGRDERCAGTDFHAVDPYWRRKPPCVLWLMGNECIFLLA